MSRALGMLETYGLLAAIEGLDAALKSANVSVRSFKYVSGGLVAWFVTGEVGAVRVAVSAGKAAASRVGDVVSDHVIARTATDVAESLPPPERPGKRKGGTGIHRRNFPVKAEKPKSSDQSTLTEPPKTPPKKAPAAKAPAASSSSKLYTQEELEAIRTTALRTLARQTEGVEMTRIEIRDARKAALVEKILDAQEKARG